MKLKSYYFIFAAATIMFGCSNEGISGPEDSDIIGTPDEDGMVYVEFTAGAKGELTRGNAVSRTALQDDGNVWWSPNDEINVFHAYNENGIVNYPNHKFTRKDENTLSEKAKFGGYLSSNEIDSYYCLGMYPYNKDAIMSFGQDGTYRIQTFLNGTQYFPSGGGYDPAACISFADLNFSKAGDKVFKLAVGMIGFNFSDTQNLGGRKLKSILLGLDNDQNNSLGGKVAVDVANGQTDFNPKFEGMTNIIGKMPDNEVINGKTYYLCVAPLPSYCNLTLTFVLDDNTLYSRSFKVSDISDSETDQILMAEYYTINNIILDISSFKMPEVRKIKSTADFLQWYIQELPGKTYLGTVKLTLEENADQNVIDLSGYEVPLPAATFNGNFDGNGKTIRNLKIQPSLIPGSTDNYGGGLFSRLSAGVVKNLTIDGVEITPTIPNVQFSKAYLGGIAGMSVNNARIENCIVKNVKIYGSPNNGVTNIAGLVVGSSDRLTMTGCSAYGIIGVKNPETEVIIGNFESSGGLVGEFNAKNTLIGNYVYCNDNSLSAINRGANTGGILGRAYYSGNKIISCYSNISIIVDEIKNNYGTICGFYDLDNNVAVTESYYIGNTDLKEDVPGTKITRSELVNKLDALNTAIKNALPETSLIYTTNGTGDTTAPLIFGTSN